MARFQVIELDPPQVYCRVFSRDAERRGRVGDKGGVADPVLPSASKRVATSSSTRTPGRGVFPAHREESRACWLAPYSSLPFVKVPQLCLVGRVRSPQGPDSARAER